MADLITSARAQQNINQASFSSAETSTIASLVTAVSQAVRRYCRRQFDVETFDELYSGTGTYRLLLAQYPIVSVARVAGWPRAVLTIRNASGNNQRATVAVTSTGLALTTVASGVSSTDTSVIWTTYPTIQAVANAVNALGNGWSASLPNSTYALWASSDLRSIQGALNAMNFSAPLRIHADELADYEVDFNRGWLLRGHRGFDEMGFPLFARETWGWLRGIDNYRVIYTAGYATIPEEVQEACAQWVTALFWQTKENPAVYPVAPSPSVAFLLDHYRRHTVQRM